MSSKLLVTTRTPATRETVRATGVEILAEYPDALLVRATDDQADALEAAGLETLPVDVPPVQTASAQYGVEDAKAADSDAPVAVDDKRVAYYLIQLVGPVKDEWLQAIGARGCSLHETLPGYRVIAGMLPAAAKAVRSEPFVEELVQYRPAMKLSPHLRPDVDGQSLDVGALRDVGELGVSGGPEQVQISVFQGESTEDVAAEVRAADGVVLAMDARAVVARVPPEALRRLAERQGIEAILPFEFPTLANDRAAAVMNVPPNRAFGGGLTLTGQGQVVGVVDWGLDTGIEATIHPDLRGRVTIVSSPNQQAALSTDQSPFDDGAADPSGHGTHVAGSIAGNAAAAPAGSSVRPSGIAPAARVHFTAIGQRVNWGPSAPPGRAAWGLYGLPLPNPTVLFEVAYAAGARIHANSWSTTSTPNNPNTEGSYDIQASNVDRYAFAHRDALVLFPAGNNGRYSAATGQIGSDSIGPPGTAKNALTVGACENDRPPGSTPPPGLDANWSDPGRFNGSFKALGGAGHVSDNPDAVAPFSSRGPTDDNRIKPEVVAPGTNVLSVRTQVFNPTYIGDPPNAKVLWGDLPPTHPLFGRYCWSGGTCMACALVAGVAALVRQYLVAYPGHQQDGVAPSGALLKGYLVNGAAPMPGAGTPPRPNNVNGFGRIDVARSLTPGTLRLTSFSDDPTLAVATRQTRTFRMQAANPGEPVRVTLCWTDPPSPVGAGGLRNQLYLQVQPPGGGAVVDGDVTAYPTATNPTQRVVIDAPVAGDYRIQVHGVSVGTRSAGAGAPAGRVQDFALVASNVRVLSLVP